MSKILHKTTTLLIVCSIIVACLGCLTGCSNKSYKDVYNLADSYSNSIVNRNISKIKSASSNITDEEVSGIESILNYKENNIPENIKLIDAAIESLDYKIDAGSIVSDSNSGSVNVIFTVLDPEKIVEKADSTETTDITVTLEMINENGVWKVSNSYSAATASYEFINNIIALNNPGVTCASCSWWDEKNVELIPFHTREVTFSDIEYLSVEITLNDEKYAGDIYYTISKDGKVVYTSAKDDWNYVFVYAYECGSSTENDTFMPGKYTITYYYGPYEIASDTCTIK